MFALRFTKITKEKLKTILLAQPESKLLLLHSGLVDKHSLVEELLSRDTKCLEQAMRVTLGWEFTIEED